MLKQDVPLRTGWFGYRKLDVENCIAHIRAAYAAELRLARQTQQGMEETMAQLRQENKALRQRFAQQAAAQPGLAVKTAVHIGLDAGNELLKGRTFKWHGHIMPGAPVKIW